MNNWVKLIAILNCIVPLTSQQMEWVVRSFLHDDILYDVPLMCKALIGDCHSLKTILFKLRRPFRVTLSWWHDLTL